jgi:hypothetical protein
MAGILGLRGTGDWGADVRPKDYREGILYLYPNGKAPLTALTAKMTKKKATDPEFFWWEQGLPGQYGAVTGVYTTTALDVAITGAASSAGDVVYAKCAATTASHFRAGHVAMFATDGIYNNQHTGLVTTSVQNGANSYIGVKLLKDDDASATTSKDLSDCDVIVVIGSANAEGAGRPSAISYDPTKRGNLTQIFRNSLEETRTAMQTKYRTFADSQKELKRQTLELHSIEQEMAFLFGEKSEGTGANGKPLRTTQGLISAIQEFAPTNVFSFKYASDYAAKTWLQGGEDFLDTRLEQLFRYGDSTKLAFCGSGALLALQKLLKSVGTWNFEAKTIDYGLNVTKWVTPFGEIYFKTHPLMTQNALFRNMMVAFEPKNIVYRPIQDTIYKADKGLYASGASTLDGISEEFLTEGGLEFHFPETGAVFADLGATNVVSAG